MQKKFLFVLTSHDELGDTGEKTGFYYSEMAEAYYFLQDNGVDVSIASIKGGDAPFDPISVDTNEAVKNVDPVNRFREDTAALDKLKNSLKIENVRANDFNGLYLTGGHGAMWDFPENEILAKLVTDFWMQGKIVSAVCHGAAGLLSAVNLRGEPLVKGREICCFTDDEERVAQRHNIVPFLLESKIRELGGRFEKVDPFEDIVVSDGQLITGQNPASVPRVAHQILNRLGLDKKRKTAGKI